MPWRATELMSQVTHITGNTDAPLTMSSVEIAELTGKRPADVKRDIRNMLEAMGSTTEQFCSHMKVPMPRGGYRKQEVYALPRREVDILLTGYSVPLRAKVIDRWRELEAEVAKPAFAVPTSFAEALRLASELEEQRVALTHQVGIQAAKIAEDKPKADYYEHVRDAKNTETIGDFAKILGFGRNKLFEWLRDQNILMHNNMPQQKHIDQGHFRVLDKEHTTDKGKKITYKQTVLTGKGKTYVQKRLKKAGNPDLGED